jgi:hypothetical protein
MIPLSERKPIEMSKHTEHGGPHFSDGPDRGVPSMLMKIQRQLTCIENKLDNLISQLQEGTRPERASDGMRTPKKSFLKVMSGPGKARSYEKKKQKKGPRSEDISGDQPFYSRFRKAGGGPGAEPRHKPDRPKRK